MKRFNTIVRISSRFLTLLIFALFSFAVSAQTANDDYYDAFIFPTHNLYDILGNDDHALFNYSVSILSTNNAHSSTSIVNKQLKYKAIDNFSGLDSVQYELCQFGNCNTAWVYINVFDQTDPNIELVYPGDANNDGVVNSDDILEIGLNYEEQGFERIVPGNTFTGVLASDWYVNGYNGKHIDCDGSGVINADDTLAISLNFNGTTNKTWVNNASESDYDVNVYWEEDSLIPGQAAHLVIDFGTENEPAEDVYGYSIDITYDPGLVEEGSARPDFSGHWLSSDDAYVKMSKDNETSVISLGFSRTDRVAKTGHGPVVKIKMIIEDNINGKNVGEVAIGYPKVIDNQGNEKSVNIITASAPIANKKKDVIEDIIYGSHAVVSPNPARDYVNVTTVKGKEIENIKIFSATGELVDIAVNERPSVHMRLDVAHLSNQIYFLHIQTEDGVYSKKLMLNR